jgi:hypothetical protein
VVACQSNGTGSANSTSSADVKTTQCWHHGECRSQQMCKSVC